MENKNEKGFVVVFSFFVLFIPFLYHGAASEDGKGQYDELIRLRELAKSFGDNQTAFSYQIRADAWGWALSDKFTVMNGVVAGFIGGMTQIPFMYLIIKLFDRQKIDVRITEPKYFILSTLPIVSSFSIYEIISGIFDSHLQGSPIDLAIVGCFSFLLSLIIFLHYYLKNRETQFSNHTNPKGENFRTSVKLEHETWKQLLQSVIYATFLLFGTALVTIFISTNEVKDIMAINNAIFFSGIQIVIIIFFFFGIYFGVYTTIISHLIFLTDKLRSIPSE